MSAPTKCLLNGNGRIGRLVVRYSWEDPTLEVVHINDVCSAESAAYLLKYDSVHGTWDKDVKCVDDSTILIDGKSVRFSQKVCIADIDLTGIELVMECTGKFLSISTLQPYVDRGVQHVVVSAPVKEKGALNVVLGCNHEKFVDQKIITNASCTTNCLAPVVKVIQASFGIKHGCITTIHVRYHGYILFDGYQAVSLGLSLAHPCLCKPHIIFVTECHGHANLSRHAQYQKGRLATCPFRYGQSLSHQHGQCHRHCGNISRAKGQAEWFGGPCPTH
jgi:hypothetical protein